MVLSVFGDFWKFEHYSLLPTNYQPVQYTEVSFAGGASRIRHPIIASSGQPIGLTHVGSYCKCYVPSSLYYFALFCNLIGM